LIQAAGARLWFLPPYSPDFNPIEQAFAKIISRVFVHRPNSSFVEARYRHLGYPPVSLWERNAAVRRLRERGGILRAKNPDRLSDWMSDAHDSGLYGLRRFVLTLRNDMGAVRNAVSERWSNGQAEGQINRLKMLKRAMYGRADTNILRARMLPLQPPTL
jgi:Transposase/DDE superfamily endonuclease